MNNQAYQLQKLRNRTRHEFLLTFFDKSAEYQEQEVNGYHLIKQFNRVEKSWDVAVYSKAAYEKRKVYQGRMKDLIEPRRNKQKRG